MAEQYDKIIQDGRTSFVPRSNKTRAFWTKHNARVAGSQNAAKETVTIQPATDDEVAEWQKPPEAVTSKLATIQPIQIANPEMEELKKQLAVQQELINKLLLEKADGGEKERVKPGPKPKTESNGENKETNDAKA